MPGCKAYEIVAGGVSIKSDKVSAPADGHQDAAQKDAAQKNAATSNGTREIDDCIHGALEASSRVTPSRQGVKAAMNPQ